jgi:eukaryotic-like serine/threonine-protein kinase
MDRYHQLKEIFQAALEHPPNERAAFLSRVCATDATLRTEVAALLADYESAEGFLETPALAVAPALTVDEKDTATAGRRIGPYRILREIGHGGMGAVYLAERDDAQYQKQVAIKLIRGGLDSGFITNRFQQERQILARLSHPYIAQLLDGGATEEGWPYLVMEYVDGQPLDEYCDGHKLLTVERLKLFRQVCAAVHYAHQNLVVHRDLKPGNILVTKDGVPKLLDFGIAKLLAVDEGVDGSQTLTVMRMLTPDYASPEQVTGQPITTASDVYSLGVLLYELLTGHRPYRVKSLAPQEMARIICEQEPDRPSTVVSRVETIHHNDGTTQNLTPEMVSATREGQPEKLRRRLAGDLDNIVLMALRKEPERRYASVEQFSEDLRRHLEGLPVSARNATLGYRVAKFVNRHRAGVGAAALILLSLVAGMIATVWQARVAQAERARAERRFNDVRRLANSFLFEFHDGIEKLPGATPMRELVINRALEYLDSLAREAGNDAGLQNELATAYERIGNIQSSFGWANKGDTAAALASFRKALTVREALAAASPQQASAQLALAAALGKVGQTLIHTHDFQGAAAHLRRAQSLLEPMLAREPQHAETRRELRNTLTWLGQALSEQSQPEPALNALRQALRLAEAELAQNPADRRAQRGMATILAEMGYQLLGTGAKTECVNLYRRSLAIFRQLAEAASHDPQARRDLALAYNRLGDALYETGDVAGELENYRESLRLREELAAADPNNAQARHDLATGYYNFGYALAQKGETVMAVETYRKAIALIEAVSAANPANARFRANVAMFYVYFGKLWEMLATKEPLPRATQRQRWETARLWYQRALVLVNEMRAQNLPTGSAVSTPAQLNGHLARCDAALAKLKAR